MKRSDRLPDTDLEPIRCAKCGGVVPLADAEHEHCPYCGNQTALPEEYRAAFRAQRDDAPTRARAEQLYRELSRRSSFVLRVFAFLFSGWTWLVSGGLMVVAGMVIADGALLLAGRLLHEHMLDVESRGFVDWWTLGGTIGFLAIGTVLGAYGRRKALSTAALQAALAARPPSRAGGPAECRICGAPLSVPADALGVRCTYCGGDNLVEVPASVLRKVVATSKEVALRAGDAAKALAEEHRRLGRSALTRTAITVGTFGGYVGLLALALPAHPPARKPTHFDTEFGLTYQEDVAARMLVRRATLEFERTWGLYGPGPRAGKCAPVRVLWDECAGGTCTVHLFAALHRGEQLSLRSPTLPAGTRVRFEHHHLNSAAWPRKPSEPFGPVEARGTIGGAQTATLHAMWTSWYEAAISVPKRNRSGLTLCVQWHRAGGS